MKFRSSVWRIHRQCLSLSIASRRARGMPSGKLLWRLATFSSMTLHRAPCSLTRFFPCLVLPVRVRMSPTSIFFVASPILEGGSNHALDAIGTKGTGEVVSELRAKLLFNLPDALLGHAKGLGAAGLLTEKLVDNATTQDGGVVGLEPVHKARQGLKDGLAVLGALHGDILAQSACGDDRADCGPIGVTDRLVDADTARRHRAEACCDVIDIEVKVGGDGLWRGVLANDLAGLLKRGPQLLGGTGATVERTGVGLDMLLTLSTHPHASVGREAGLLGGVELVDGDEDALGGACEQIVEVNACADMLLGDLVGQANVGRDEAASGLVADIVAALRRGGEGDKLHLLGLVEDDSGCCDGREKIRHCVASRRC